MNPFRIFLVLVSKFSSHFAYKSLTGNFTSWHSNKTYRVSRHISDKPKTASRHASAGAGYHYIII